MRRFREDDGSGNKRQIPFIRVRVKRLRFGQVMPLKELRRILDLDPKIISWKILINDHHMVARIHIASNLFSRVFRVARFYFVRSKIMQMVCKKKVYAISIDFLYVNFGISVGI